MLGSNEARRQLLRSSSLFSHLSDSDADAILVDARVTRHPAGTQIFAKGDPGNSMMAVLHGRVVISNPSPDGRQIVVTIFRDGDVFGEIALLVRLRVLDFVDVVRITGQHGPVGGPTVGRLRQPG